jgi:hypothetical protein
MRQAKFNCREQAKALMDPFRSVYVFAQWPCNRLVGQANPGALVRQIRPHPRGRIVSELGYDCSRVLIRRFVAYEVRVISTKKEAFQALRISKNVTRNPLTFRAKEIGESVDGASKPLVY